MEQLSEGAAIFWVVLCVAALLIVVHVRGTRPNNVASGGHEPGAHDRPTAGLEERISEMEARAAELEAMLEALDDSGDQVSGTEAAQVANAAAPPRSLTDNQLCMLSFMKRRGGVQIAYGGLVRFEDVPALSGPGEARTLRSLVRAGLATEPKKGLFYITSSGQLALVNAGRL
jgi:hypothetical protein